MKWNACVKMMSKTMPRHYFLELSSAINYRRADERMRGAYWPCKLMRHFTALIPWLSSFSRLENVSIMWAQELVYHLMWIVIGRKVDENLKGMIKLKVFLICSILSNIKKEIGWSLLLPWFIFIFSVNIIWSYMPVCSWSALVWPTTSTSLVPEIIILDTKIFAKHLI